MEKCRRNCEKRVLRGEVRRSRNFSLVFLLVSSCLGDLGVLESWSSFKPAVSKPSVGSGGAFGGPGGGLGGPGGGCLCSSGKATTETIRKTATTRTTKTTTRTT